MIKHMSRETWLSRLQDNCEQIGNCVEWQGRKMQGKTPVVYVPRGYLRPELTQSSHSARMVIWTLAKGEPPPEGHVLRAKCRNDSCVSMEHMVLISREKLPKDQGRRGEFSTTKRNAAAVRRARERDTKLDADKARAIRESCESSYSLAAVYGVSPTSIRAVRRGDLWAPTVTGSSVFSWRP
jgi:hypothetical protein